MISKHLRLFKRKPEVENRKSDQSQVDSGIQSSTNSRTGSVLFETKNIFPNKEKTKNGNPSRDISINIPQPVFSIIKEGPFD